MYVQSKFQNNRQKTKTHFINSQRLNNSNQSVLLHLETNKAKYAYLEDDVIWWRFITSSSLLVQRIRISFTKKGSLLWIAFSRSLLKSTQKTIPSPLPTEDHPPAHRGPFPPSACTGKGSYFSCFIFKVFGSGRWQEVQMFSSSTYLENLHACLNYYQMQNKSSTVSYMLILNTLNYTRAHLLDMAIIINTVHFCK